jgi:hypothetical protein
LTSHFPLLKKSAIPTSSAKNFSNLSSKPSPRAA